MFTRPHFPQHGFHFHFCCYGGMISAGNPTSLHSTHPCTPDEDILNRIIQNMPNCETSRYIGRWNNNGKRLFIGINRSVEIVSFQPVSVPLFFNGLWIVNLREMKFGHSYFSNTRLKAVVSFKTFSFALIR